MNCVKVATAFIAAFFLISTACAGELKLETGWLKSEVGHQSDPLGVKVVDVQENASKITISIPKKNVPQLKEIEEVLVIGEKPEKLEMPSMRKIKYEFVKDYDNDNYGLVIYLGSRQQIPFRLYLKGED